MKTNSFYQRFRRTRYVLLGLLIYLAACRQEPTPGPQGIPGQAGAQGPKGVDRAGTEG